MSIQSEIERIKENVKAAYRAILAKMPGESIVDSGRISEDLAYHISRIPTGTDTSDATAAAGDILSGKTAYVKGAKVTGNIKSLSAWGTEAESVDSSPSQIALTGKMGITGVVSPDTGITVYTDASSFGDASASDVMSGKTFTSASGLKVTGAMPAATQATPGISVSSGGLITASATQTAGYVDAGTKSATKQLDTQAAATITPGTAAKTAVASGRYTTGEVKVAGDANLIAANIKNGVSIFGVAGSYAGSGGGASFGTFRISGVASGVTTQVKLYDGSSSLPSISTNPSTAKACMVAGLTFTGPSTTISSLNVSVSGGGIILRNDVTVAGSGSIRPGTREAIILVPLGANVILVATTSSGGGSIA